MEQGIYKAINAIMGEIEPISKGRTNTQQNFKYRGIEDVMNALQPILVKNGVFIVPEVLEQTREERQTKSGGNLLYSILKVKHTFYHIDGSSISAITTGEGMDSADKASNKAMSVAYKYACFEVFNIPTEEMKDPDADTPDPAPKQKEQPKKEPPKKDADKEPTGISKSQSDALVAKVAEVWDAKIARSKLKEVFGIDKPADVQQSAYKGIMDRLEKIKNGTDNG